MWIDIGIGMCGVGFMIILYSLIRKRIKNNKKILN